MQKVSYMGNGETTEFAFNFPYFENSNIIVTKNNVAATGYEIIGNPGGLDADIPYIGGRVVFEIAPTALDNITIARQLPLSRVTDYQPLEKISPTTLNQDMNYMMEILKDLQDEFETLQTQYSEIADKESTTTLLAQIAAIHSEIVTVAAQITALGDISTLRQDVTTNSENITTLGTQKSNTDMDNLSTTGKTTLSTLSMPSDSYVDDSYTKEDNYTAPANGYYYLRATGGSSGSWLCISLGSSASSGTNLTYKSDAGSTLTVIAPVSKNQVVTPSNSGNTVATWRFYYAKGEI